jgi:uncharacterized delta-60 repeat protein
MWQNFRHLTRVLSRNNRRTTSRRSRVSTRRPQLEALEDRCLLSAGVLDPTFGNGAGYVTTSTSSGNDYAHSVLIQPNGDIIALGRAETSTPSELAAVRYNPDGSLDTSFGSGGIALASFGSNFVFGPSAALYPPGTANAGEILQEGSFGNNQILVRYNTSGTLDSTFGTGGEVVNALPINSINPLPQDMVITSTGQIVTLASYYGSVSNQFVLTRYNANGSLDTTFGQGGYVNTTVPGSHFVDGARLLQQPNGDLIVTAESSPGGNGGIWNLYRFNANGTPDTSFGNQGVVSTVAPLGPEAAVLYPNAGTPNDGQIVVVGQASNGTMLLARYNPNGSLDTTFGSGGLMQTQISIADVNAAMVTLDASGRILVTGAEGSATEVARFNVNGTADTTFGSGGVVTTTFGTSSYGYAVALYPNAGTANDGKLVVVGKSNNGTKDNVLVARYLGDSAGFAVTGFPSSITAGTVGTFTVRATNADGSTNTGYTGTVHFTSSDPKAVLPADYTFTAADQGSHTFSATLKRAGSQSITATDTMTNTLVGSESGIMVQPAAASQFILSAPSSVSKGAKFSLTVTVEDAFGNVVTGYVGTVHFTSSDSTATLPADYTFTAADAGVHTFVSKATLRKRGTQTITVTDTQNSALTATDSINVT